MFPVQLRTELCTNPGEPTGQGMSGTLQQPLPSSKILRALTNAELEALSAVFLLVEMPRSMKKKEKLLHTVRRQRQSKPHPPGICASRVQSLFGNTGTDSLFSWSSSTKTLPRFSTEEKPITIPRVRENARGMSSGNCQGWSFFAESWNGLCWERP